MSIQITPELKPFRVKPGAKAMPDAVEMPGSTAGGRVSWFNSQKQFGFVRLDEGMGDAFLHMSILKPAGYYSLPRGTRVQVRVEPDRGKHKVVEVLKVDTSTAQHGEPPPLIRKLGLMRSGQTPVGGPERFTIRRVVFGSPFTLGEDPEVYPSGTYDVETKEELVERGGHTARVRTGTMLIIPTATGTRSRPVGGGDLEEALARDGEAEPSDNPDRDGADD